MQSPEPTCSSTVAFVGPENNTGPDSTFCNTPCVEFSIARPENAYPEPTCLSTVAFVGPENNTGPDSTFCNTPCVEFSIVKPENAYPGMTRDTARVRHALRFGSHLAIAEQERFLSAIEETLETAADRFGLTGYDLVPYARIIRGMLNRFESIVEPIADRRARRWGDSRFLDISFELQIQKAQASFLRDLRRWLVAVFRVELGLGNGWLDEVDEQLKSFKMAAVRTAVIIWRGATKQRRRLAQSHSSNSPRSPFHTSCILACHGARPGPEAVNRDLPPQPPRPSELHALRRRRNHCPARPSASPCHPARWRHRNMEGSWFSLDVVRHLHARSRGTRHLLRHSRPLLDSGQSGALGRNRPIRRASVGLLAAPSPSSQPRQA